MTILGVGTVTLMTPVAAASQTTIDFAIPAGVKNIDVEISGLSTNGTSSIIVQIGDAGGVETSGYSGTNVIASSSVTRANMSSGFMLTSGPSAANIMHGLVRLRRFTADGLTWVAGGSLGLSDAAVGLFLGGSKSLTQELTTVRVTTGNGTDVFDAGSVTVQYQS